LRNIFRKNFSLTKAFKSFPVKHFRDYISFKSISAGFLIRVYIQEGITGRVDSYSQQLKGAKKFTVNARLHYELIKEHAEIHSKD
jgi:hypothetical protein